MCLNETVIGQDALFQLSRCCLPQQKRIGNSLVNGEPMDIQFKRHKTCQSTSWLQGSKQKSSVQEDGKRDVLEQPFRFTRLVLETVIFALIAVSKDIIQRLVKACGKKRSRFEGQVARKRGVLICGYYCTRLCV